MKLFALKIITLCNQTRMNHLLQKSQEKKKKKNIKMFKKNEKFAC